MGSAGGTAVEPAGCPGLSCHRATPADTLSASTPSTRAKTWTPTHTTNQQRQTDRFSGEVHLTCLLTGRYSDEMNCTGKEHTSLPCFY